MDVPGQHRDDLDAALHARERSRRVQQTAGWAFATVFLVFLVPTLVYGVRLGGARGWAGAAVVLVFASWYVGGNRYTGFAWSPVGVGARPWRFIGAWLGGLLILAAAAFVLLGAAAAFPTVVFVVVACGICLPPVPASLVTVAVAAATAVIGLVAGLTGGATAGMASSVFFPAFIVIGSGLLARATAAEAEAGVAQAEHAVDLERARLARDLHDIVGHALTVIAVKAELTERLIDTDPARARDEAAQVGRLARTALADTRAAVTAYREPSLVVELVRARRALDAAGLRADLPASADEVPEEMRGLYAWVLREGVTNVLRHAGASTCVVSWGPAGMTVRDDGAATGPITAGNGLVGLTERARLAGATLSVTAAPPHGVELAIRTGRA